MWRLDFVSRFAHIRLFILDTRYFNLRHPGDFQRCGPAGHVSWRIVKTEMHILVGGEKTI